MWIIIARDVASVSRRTNVTVSSRLGLVLDKVLTSRFGSLTANCHQYASKGDERCPPVVSDTEKFDRGLKAILHDDYELHWLDVPETSTSSVLWCTGVCMDKAPRYPSLQSTSSQPLMLLLAVVVYDLPIGTVSLCLAVDSARTAVGRCTTPARQSGTRWLCHQINLEMRTASIVLNGSWKQLFSLAAIWCDQRIRDYFITCCQCPV